MDDSDAISISYIVTVVSSPFVGGASTGIVAQMKMITFFLFKLHDPRAIAVIGYAHMDISNVPGDDTLQASRIGTCSMGALRSVKERSPRRLYSTRSKAACPMEMLPF